MHRAMTAAEFHEVDGTANWHVLAGAAHACYALSEYGQGIALVQRVGEIAERLGHHPDVTVRYGEAHIVTSTHELGQLSVLDAELAVEIGAVAAELGLEPAAAPAVCEVAIDALDRESILPFWAAVLGYRVTKDRQLVDPRGIGPTFWFQAMDKPRPQRNRIHLDVYVEADEAPARMSSALAAGGHLISDAFAPAFWVLADREGNEACLCTWQEQAPQPTSLTAII